MKPKYSQIARRLPASIFIVPAMMGMTSAAVINPDAAGNVHITLLESGPHNIQTTFYPNGSGAHIILIDSNAFINPASGDAVEVQVFNDSGDTYTINNNGILSALSGNPGEHGIDTIDIAGLATPSIAVNNTGTISGFSAIRANNTLTLVNDGTITGIGFSDGAVFAKNGATITNNSDGVITGNVHGIQSQLVTGTLAISNYGSITGTNFDGITSPGIVTLDNFSTVLGNLNGVNAGDGATITNASGATITGTNTRGITAGNTPNIGNSGTISGGISGILMLNNSTITNYTGGLISGGSNDGITAGDFTNVFNSGTISGGTHGVYLIDPTSSSVTNNVGGIIYGGFQGIRGDIGVETITNAGTITGVTNAMELGGGANIVNLNDGSVINGDVRAFGGSNAITMNGGRTSLSDSTQNIINGSVFDTVTLNKTGSGLAVVTGTTAADSISVTGGFLYLRNNVTNATGGENTVSANAAEIGGLGTWDSAITLSNGASISPGTNPLALTNTVADSIGTLTVTGDVTLDSTSKYVWNVTPGGASDQIVLTGIGNQFTTNNSDFVIAPTNVNTPLLNGSTIVVDTQDTLIGNFDSISVGTFPSSTPDNGPYYATQINPIIASDFSTLTKVNGSQDWLLTITHDYSQFGTTPNEVAAGNMLDGLVNTATGDLADLLAALDYSDAQTTANALAALDPGSFLASAAGLVSNNYHLHRTVENHNAAVRSGWGAVSMPSTVSSAKGAIVEAPMMTTGCAGTRNVWGSFSYDWQDLSTGNSAYDQKGETASFTAGIDFAISQNFRLGLVAEGSQSSWDGNGSLGSDIDTYRIAAYANWGAATGWYVDALLGYNTSSLDQSRLVSMGNFFGTQSGGYDADGWQGMITVGNTIATSAGMFSPFIGLELQQLSNDAFISTGSALPIGLSSFDIDSMRGLIGVKWEAALAPTLKAYASAAYAYEFQGDGPTTTVSFGGGSYTATGLDLGDSVLVSAGLRWNVATCTTVDFGYRGEFAMDEGLDSHGANIGVNFSF